MEIKQPMKKTLLTNLLLGQTALLVIVSLYAFTSPATKIIDQENTLSLAQARSFHTNYDQTTSTIQARIEGVYLDRATLDDMLALMQAKPDARGVRVYFGKAQDGSPMNILVVTNGQLQDDTNFLMRSFGAISICPSVCDVESPLIKQ